MAAWRRLGIVALAMATAACATPRIAVPEADTPVPATWAETPAAPATLDLAAYWQLLDDPLLTEFVETALAHNFDLAQSAARLAQARAQLRGARASFLPQIAGS